MSSSSSLSHLTSLSLFLDWAWARGYFVVAVPSSATGANFVATDAGLGPNTSVLVLACTEVHYFEYLLVLCTSASKMYLYPNTLRSTWYLKTSTLQVHPVLFQKMYIIIYFFSYSVQYFREYKFSNNSIVERKTNLVYLDVSM